MSAIQTACKVNCYHRLLQWFAEQPELAPINICHQSLLNHIYQFLLDNKDIWGTPDACLLCTIGDSVVAFYDRLADVVDLTTENGELNSDSGHEIDHLHIKTAADITKKAWTMN
jgi:hypothetical protein